MLRNLFRERSTHRRKSVRPPSEASVGNASSNSTPACRHNLLETGSSSPHQRQLQTERLISQKLQGEPARNESSSARLLLCTECDGEFPSVHRSQSSVFPDVISSDRQRVGLQVEIEHDNGREDETGMAEHEIAKNAV